MKVEKHCLKSKNISSTPNAFYPVCEEEYQDRPEV
jgi:hypothetical protein